MDKNNNNGFIVFMIFLALMFIIEGIHYFKGQNLKKNNVITSAEIYKYDSGNRSRGARINYEFFVKNKRYTGSFSPKYLCMKFNVKNKRLLGWSKICIVYNPDSPDVSAIFMKRSDERKYGKKIPDKYLETRRKFFCY